MLVAQALRDYPDKSLLKLISDEDRIVRTAAARQLQMNGGKHVFNEVESSLNDERDFVREISAFILGQLGTPDRPFKDQSIPHLKRLLRDPSNDVRATAVSAIGHLFLSSHDMPSDVSKELLSNSYDLDISVRDNAALALGSSTGDDVVVSRLNELLSDEDSDVRSSAELALELLGDRDD